jgi:hypothetical protein
VRSWSWPVLVGYPVLLFVSLNSILSKTEKKKLTPQPHGQQSKNKTQGHSGVNGTLPRIGISDHELLRVQGLHGLRSVPAPIAVKLFHRLDLAYRLPRLCARAPATDRPAWRPASNHIHILFPRRLRRCQLEATKLSVLSHLISISFSFSLSLLSFFFVFIYLLLVPCFFAKGNEKHAETETLMFPFHFLFIRSTPPSPPQIQSYSHRRVVQWAPTHQAPRR